jgi:HPt (histidine-containing phosphotransfer) domain-containing protein
MLVNGPRIKSTLTNDPDMRELIVMFVDEMPGRATKLRDVLTAAKWKDLANEAHKLRGSAGGHGFGAIGNAAGSLEDLIRANMGREEQVLASIHSKVEELASMCERAAA